MIYSLICFLVAIAVVTEVAIRKTHFFTPFKCYLFFHSTALGIALLKMSNAMTPFHTVTKLVYFGSGFAFLTGTLLPNWLRQAHQLPKQYTQLNKSKYNWNLHMLFTYCLWIMFLYGIGDGVMTYGTLPMFSDNTSSKGVIEFYNKIGFSSILINFAAIVMILFFISLVNNPSKNQKILSGLALFITFILYLTILSRGMLIFFIFFCLVYYSFAAKRLNFRKLFILGLACFIFLFSSFLIKFSNLYKNSSDLLKNEKVIEAGLEIPYKYVANNFWNLDYALNPGNQEFRHGHTWGFSSLSGLLDIFPSLSNTVRESMWFDGVFNESIQKVKGLNTIGYQWNIYKDFGVIGTILVPFIYGILISLLFMQANQQPTLLNVGLYSYLMYGVCISFAGPIWEAFIYIFGLICFLSINHLCVYRNFNKNNKSY